MDFMLIISCNVHTLFSLITLEIKNAVQNFIYELSFDFFRLKFPLKIGNWCYLLQMENRHKICIFFSF